MDGKAQIKSLLLDQCVRYPALEMQDLLKCLHQSVFGCGHFVSDEAAGLALLYRETEGGLLPDGPEAEMIGGGFCRVHLRTLRRTGLAPETLFRLFALSAAGPAGDGAALEDALVVLLDLARAGRLPFPYEETAAAVDAWRQEGFPACHHSERFRAAYRPAYRVVRQELAWALPLFAAIDRKAAEQSRVVLAIEGGSASGKTSLAALLEQVYGCRVFHMDDYFLRPEQRTAERLAEPGGNVDRERFEAEVLRPLCEGKPVVYRRYDCHTQTLAEPVEVLPAKLNVVEGAYSMHPALAGCYDLSVFLRIGAEHQRTRVLRRNGPEAAQRFFDQWIPLEQRYFDALDPERRCDLILEVDI